MKGGAGASPFYLFPSLHTRRNNMPTPNVIYLMKNGMIAPLVKATRLFAAPALAICALIAASMLSACSTKKNTALSRNWQAFTTRYNVYYNGHEHYKEQLAEMERSYEDDYTRLLMTHPAEAFADEKMPKPSGDFKRTIEKMQKAISLHSIKKKPRKKNSSKKEKEFRAREEFNPFLHNAWLTLARAQFYSGDFTGAAATFFYISRHFKWLPDVVTEAMIWQARAYCALDWLYEAEDVLRRVKPDKIQKKSLRNLYDITRADYLVRSEKFKEAVPYLENAAKAAAGSQRNRLYFLLGQVQSQLQNRDLAYSAFRKAGKGASTAYRTKFNARIRQSEVFTGSDIRSEVKALRSMARYSRNKEFLDQIYYAIGNLYMSRKDTVHALENYHRAVAESTRSGIEKALAQLALGNIYFARRDYVKAQPCYSEAVPLLSTAMPGYKTYKLRSDVLDELAVYAGNVQLQDSLLDLSKLTEEEQLKVCQRLVDELKKKEKEEADAARREEHIAQTEAMGNQNNNASAPQTYTLNTDKSWYFYNQTAKNAGKLQFQRRWGSRKLEDDWRRRNKNTFSLEEEDTSDSDSIPSANGSESTDSVTDKKTAERENDPHFVEYYMKNIPRTDDQKQTCNDIIMEGLYNMGIILKDKLEDFPAAEAEFLELNSRYPDNIYRLDAYYNLYLMAVRRDNTADAEKWRALIIAEFPESPYGKAMQDPQYFTKLRRMNQIQEDLYAEAYDAYLDDRNARVHDITANMEREYPLSPIMPKFVFIDALSYLTQKEYDKFRERLEYLLEKWPDTDMTPMASGIIKGIRQGRKLESGSSNSRGMIWNLRLSDDSIPASPDSIPAQFERDPDKPQYLVLAFDRDSVNANLLLYQVARFNFSSFVVKDFDLEPMSFSHIGLLVIKGFANLDELQHYRKVLAQSSFSLPESVRPVMISKANFELLLRQGRTFDEYFRFQAEAQKEAAGQAATDPEPQPDKPDD